MKKNILLILILAIISAIILGWIWFEPTNKGRTVSINGKKIEVEVADTPEKRALGLGERDALCRECAMLFVFPEKAEQSFWMKGMRFPLDIIWFDGENGRIIYIEKKIPADSQAVYSPPFKADRVLELNAGVADEYGIRVGDLIDQS